MKLNLPKLEIAEEEGFNPEKDIFSRKDFGERLANLIELSNGNSVIALDAQWGEGKSTFIEMWRGYIEHQRENKIKSIYFDAFANDYQKDSFLALAAEIYEVIQDESEEKKAEFKKRAVNTAKSMARGAFKLGVRAVSGGIIDGSVLDSVESDVSSLIANQVDEIIADRFQNTVKDKLAISQFREFLGQMSTDIEEPIVFIIDELDRCKPDFALELIEQIKHLFSVPGITFLLVLNRPQLQEAVKSKYGNGINATLYLQKFVNLWLLLPRRYDRYNDHGAAYVRHAMNLLLDKGENFNNSEAVELLEELVKCLKPSFREIEQILSYFALIQNMSGSSSSYYAPIQAMIAFICYLKVSSPELLDQIVSDDMNVTEIFNRLNISHSVINDNDYFNIDYLKRVLAFDLGSEEIRNKMIQDKEIEVRGGYGRAPKYVTNKVCTWLADISIN